MYKSPDQIEGGEGGGSMDYYLGIGNPIWTMPERKRFFLLVSSLTIKFFFLCTLHSDDATHLAGT